MRSLGMFAFVLVTMSLMAYLGLKVGIDGTELGIAQDCAADGYFVIERDGTPWRYTCSKPKLYGEPGLD